MRQRKNELTAERGLELLERHWKWVVAAFWLLFCAWFIVNRWTDIRLLQPRRYRRQYAHDAGPRPAPRPGLVRPRASIGCAGSNIHWSRLVDLPIAGLILRPSAAPRRRRGRALGGRDRAAHPLSAAAVLGRADGSAAGRPPRLSARLPRLVLRRIDQRHVHARADRPSRLAARFGRAGDMRRLPTATACAAGSCSASPPRCRWRSGSRL